MLLEISPDNKLMLWAHWSHLAYSESVAGRSVGHHLRQTLGKRLYTIVPVAERGTAIVIFPKRSSDEDIGFRWMPGGADRFSKRMQGLSSEPFFLDLRDPSVRSDETFADIQPVWIESRRVDVSLSDNVDGIIWLQRIRPPTLPLPILLIMGGMHYRSTLAVSAALVVAIGVIAIRLRRRRRDPSAHRA